MKPGNNGSVINEHGIKEEPPGGWEFLPAGDAAITRKVTAKGNYWKIQEKKGRRIFSKGIWAPATDIADAKKAVEALRNSPQYEKKRKNALVLRDKKQETYATDFQIAVCNYLGFHSKYKQYENIMAELITAHAIPIGSGTVARTKTIPLKDRASKAVIAWMRHQTTPYDTLKIARIKGQRRTVRKDLAKDSVKLLEKYRKGDEISMSCPLLTAIKNSKSALIINQ